MILSIQHPLLPEYNAFSVSSGSAVLHNKAKQAIGPPAGKEWVVTFKATGNKKRGQVLDEISRPSHSLGRLHRHVQQLLACLPEGKLRSLRLL